MQISNIIRSMKLLQRMEKAGIIKLHKDTAAFGYINDGPTEFEFENVIYNVEYFDGCFYPFVIWNKDKTQAKYYTKYPTIPWN